MKLINILNNNSNFFHRMRHANVDYYLICYYHDKVEQIIYEKIKVRNTIYDLIIF